MPSSAEDAAPQPRVRPEFPRCLLGRSRPDHARTACRSSILAWAERSAQIFHCRDEGLHVVLVVVEVKARPDILIAVRGDDVPPPELLRQPAAVARRHGDGGAAPLVLRGSDARPAVILAAL